ncbi:uncharacterized protein STEHIDRAFT_141073 [Stereum hirsutum FP-91666 SS1]|uniref:uncharacterized protein n=1 Tax=Stereum hirsutum (strain FP-91666) TaxID=721885 RepID=UPI00044494D5|nr:uncharacterized protein STEHIDRAFT_141073 [Stereum hirsutum FP-91666 SS1]EIM83245.1 hypothetical protein STEHIDRAFT_141073 [Stereum hirsutum FP-91666 SS1]
MGNNLSLGQARAINTASFAVNFATQVYGMVTEPDMKQVADANHFAFSPNPYFIAGVFSLQSLGQALWLRDLWKMPPPTVDEDAELAEVREASLAYSPIFALGNLCIAGWLAFWLKSSFGASQALVTINSFSQIYAIYAIPHFRGLPLTSSSSNANTKSYVTRTSWLLHFVAKTFAGVGVLDFVDNGGVWMRSSNPSGLVRALTGVGFTALGLTSDPIFGATLIYDLIALYVGQSGEWRTQLGWIAGATTVAVGIKSVSLLAGSGRSPSVTGGKRGSKYGGPK